MDEDEVEGLIGGTWAPYCVVAGTAGDVENSNTGAFYQFVPLYANTVGFDETSSIRFTVLIDECLGGCHHGKRQLDALSCFGVSPTCPCTEHYKSDPLRK